jgi:hypothetical protein
MLHVDQTRKVKAVDAGAASSGLRRHEAHFGNIDARGNVAVHQVLSSDFEADKQLRQHASLRVLQVQTGIHPVRS